MADGTENEITQIDDLDVPLVVPTHKLDADQYSADDIDGVTEGLFGSGNMHMQVCRHLKLMLFYHPSLGILTLGTLHSLIMQIRTLHVRCRQGRRILRQITRTQFLPEMKQSLIQTEGLKHLLSSVEIMVVRAILLLLRLAR